MKIFAAVALAAAFLLTPHAVQADNGNFMNTCSDCSLKANMLECNCKMKDGKTMKKSMIDLNSGISNCDGALWFGTSCAGHN